MPLVMFGVIYEAHFAMYSVLKNLCKRQDMNMVCSCTNVLHCYALIVKGSASYMVQGLNPVVVIPVTCRLIGWEFCESKIVQPLHTLCGALCDSRCSVELCTLSSLLINPRAFFSL